MAGRRKLLSKAIWLKDDDKVAHLALEECDAMGFVCAQSSTERATFEALECVDDFSGETPLLIQCFLGHVAGVTLLLQARANPNAASLGGSGGVTGNTGKPALLCVAEMGYTDVLATLLEFNANVDSTDKHGRTALHAAAKNGHVDAVKILLEWGAAKERQDNMRWRAMHQGARYGHVGVVKELMRVNADVNAAGESKNTPLHYAARHGHVGVLQALAQDTELDLGLLNQHSKSALHFAQEAREHSLKSLSADQLESKRNEDALLRIAFDTFADQEYPQNRMSKMQLVQALYSLHFGHDEDGMDQLLMRVDSNSDGTAFGRAFAHACICGYKNTHTHIICVCVRARIYLSIFLSICAHTHTLLQATSTLTSSASLCTRNVCEYCKCCHRLEAHFYCQRCIVSTLLSVILHFFA